MSISHVFVLDILSIMCYFVSSQSDVPNDLSASFDVTEESPPFSYVGNVAESARLSLIFNSSTIQHLEYSLIPKPGTQSTDFQLDSRTGELRTQSVMDRDVLCPGEVDCNINLDIAIVKPTELFQVISVQINLLDINDQAPVFTPSQYHVRFSESDPVGTSRNLPVAFDLDSPQYGVKEYRLALTVDKFKLLQVNNPINGLIDLKLEIQSALDRELRDSYQVLVEASDYGRPPLMGSLLIEVTVDDDNDHSPEFSNDLYEVEIPENLPVDDIFFTIQATDNDRGDNGKVIYDFSQRTSIMHGNLFNISRDTGDVFLKGPLDFEDEDVYHLEVTASDLGSNPHSSLTTLKVVVLDVNDNLPVITISTLTDKTQAEVSENLPAGQFTAHVSILDADSGQNGVVSCSLTHALFDLEEIRTNQYKITTTGPLDREVEDIFILQVHCSDLGYKPLSASENITVLVLDQNDNVPRFSEFAYNAAVPENVDRDTTIIRVTALDQDLGENSEITYHILQQNVSRYVRIDAVSGTIHAAKTLDHEEVHRLRFSVRATDRGQPAQHSDVPVSISIIDSNDEAPRFVEKHYTLYVSENEPSQTYIGTVTATDNDSPPFDRFEFSLSRQNDLDKDLFYVDSDTGHVYTKDVLDHEERGIYHLNLFATDSADISLVGTAFLTVIVEDRNDNAPVLHFPLEENTTFPISNRVPVSYNITKVFATDPDNGMNSNLSFSLISGNSDIFRIDPKFGFIQTNMDLSGLTHEVFELGIRVSDDGDPPLVTDVIVVVVVDDAVPFYVQELPQAMVQKTNLTIIIAVAVVSGFVIVILVIAIVVLKTTHFSRPIFPRKADGDKGQRMFTDLNVRALEAHGQLQQRVDVTVQVPATVDLSHNLRPDILHKYEMETDVHSMSSADMSNTDSGRGPSEVGGETHYRHDFPRSSQRRSSHPAHPAPHRPHGYQHTAHHTASDSNTFSAKSHPTTEHQLDTPQLSAHGQASQTCHHDRQDLREENSKHCMPGVHNSHNTLYNGYYDNTSNNISSHGHNHHDNRQMTDNNDPGTRRSVRAGPKRIIHAVDV